MSASEYFAIEQQRLFLEARKIALFTSHGPTLGAYREAILRSYLRKLTPESLRVTSGFVSPNSNHEDLTAGQSRQIDVLIHDADGYAPLLETEGMAVIRPHALRACVEVKSKLTLYKKDDPSKSSIASKEYPLVRGYSSAFKWAGTLIESLQNIHSCAKACESRVEAGYLSAIFAYESTFKSATLYRALDSGELQEQLGVTNLRQLPRVICSFSDFVILFSNLDMYENGPQFPSTFESFFNFLGAGDDHDAIPFQFFSTFFYNQLGLSHNGRQPESSGLSGLQGRAEVWSHHFDLSSEGF